MSDAQIIKDMAHLLVCKKADLGDERAVFRALQVAYRAPEIMALSDAAIELARKLIAESGEPQ